MGRGIYDLNLPSPESWYDSYDSDGPDKPVKPLAISIEKTGGAGVGASELESEGKSESGGDNGSDSDDVEVDGASDSAWVRAT